MTMTLSERNDRLDSMIAEGRIVRLNWGETTDNGRETACLLAALSPEVGIKKFPAACPAEVMPEWFAHLTIWMDDHGSWRAWPAMVLRYAAVARRWHVLTTEDWRRLYYTARRVAIEEAVSHIPAGAGSEERAACALVVALCWRGAAGDYPTKVEWEAAAAAAGVEATKVPWAPGAGQAARIAARAAQIAARTELAKKPWAAGAAEAAEAAERWVAGDTRFVAADRITDAILDAIEVRCDRRTAVVS